MCSSANADVLNIPGEEIISESNIYNYRYLLI